MYSCRGIWIQYIYFVQLLAAAVAVSSGRDLPATEDGQSIHLSAHLAETQLFHGAAAGILHSFNATHPPIDKVEPLHLHMYRGPERFHLYDNCTSTDTPSQQCPRLFSNTARLETLGIRTQLLLSDIFFAVRDHYRLPDTLLPGDDGDFSLWEEVVSYCVEAAVSFGHVDVYWDIYNEPNIGYENRSIEQFYEVWKSAYALIKSRIPQAIVVGPSIADVQWNESFQWIEDFILNQQKSECLPDVLCWHVGYNNGSVLVGQHEQVTEFLTAKNINITRIAHNEVIGPKSSLSPGVAVSFLANLERLGVDHACRACWREYDYLTGEKSDTCWDQSLDGLLMVNGLFEVRSVWWVYKYYADMSGWLSHIEGPMGEWQLDGLLTWKTGGNISVLLGRIGDFSDQEITVNLTVSGLEEWLGSGDSTLCVSISFVPYTGMLPLYEPVPVEQSCALKVRDGALTIQLPGMHSDEAIWITVR